jgi:NAD(P)-dependent dehydrogenase (short-subunit alcohol dehydrogenase family)
MSKVWFITGAGSGIGAGTARAALKAGHRVVATGRSLEKLRSALGDVTATTSCSSGWTSPARPRRSGPSMPPSRGSAASTSW